VIERVTCQDCGSRQFAKFTTDGNGRLVDVTPPCLCPESRKRHRICQHCTRSVRGPRSFYCEGHWKIVRKEVGNRYTRGNGKETRARYRAENRERLAAYDRATRLANREQRAAYMREYRKLKRAA
jgi:hypothetical protein